MKGASECQVWMLLLFCQKDKNVVWKEIPECMFFVGLFDMLLELWYSKDKITRENRTRKI